MKELTFLFTDIENSTMLWERHPIAMQEALNGKTVDWLEQVSDQQYRG